MKKLFKELQFKAENGIKGSSGFVQRVIPSVVQINPEFFEHMASPEELKEQSIRYLLLTPEERANLARERAIAKLK